jgi:hypothetical protein
MNAPVYPVQQQSLQIRESLSGIENFDFILFHMALCLLELFFVLPEDQMVKLFVSKLANQILSTTIQ